MGKRTSWMVFAAALVTFAAGTAQAVVTIETVPVGNAGNAADNTGYGAVAYDYNIGKYEVTAGQYTEFLNAKAKTDTLYNTNMANAIWGCGITRSGSAGSYFYSVASDYTNRPVNYVSFWDAARFTNWLQNGQGNGDTETGAYTLTPTGIANNTITKNAGATWWVPSEDEWYKAAYHNKIAGTAASYFLYPTRSNTLPGQDMADPSGNNANYYTAPYAYPIDSGKYTTVAGEFQNSASPYGTFDQGGNVWEWNDSILDGSYRGLRGGSFNSNNYSLPSSYRDSDKPSYESGSLGFRVASVPEPGSISLLIAGAMAGLIWWRRR